MQHFQFIILFGGPGRKSLNALIKKKTNNNIIFNGSSLQHHFHTVSLMLSFSHRVRHLASVQSLMRFARPRCSQSEAE